MPLWNLYSVSHLNSASGKLPPSRFRQMLHSVSLWVVSCLTLAPKKRQLGPLPNDPAALKEEAFLECVVAFLVMLCRWCQSRSVFIDRDTSWIDLFIEVTTAGPVLDELLFKQSEHTNVISVESIGTEKVLMRSSLDYLLCRHHRPTWESTDTRPVRSWVLITDWYSQVLPIWIWQRDQKKKMAAL